MLPDEQRLGPELGVLGGWGWGLGWGLLCFLPYNAWSIQINLYSIVYKCD